MISKEELKALQNKYKVINLVRLKKSMKAIENLLDELKNKANIKSEAHMSEEDDIKLLQEHCDNLDKIEEIDAKKPECGICGGAHRASDVKHERIVRLTTFKGRAIAFARKLFKKGDSNE